MSSEQQRITWRGGMALATVCLLLAGAASAADTKPAPRPRAAMKASQDAGINAQQLAIVDRTLAFCGPIDADSAKKLKDQVTAITKGASPDAVTEVRNSELYKAAYASMDTFVGQIDPRNAKTLCVNGAHGK